MNSVLLAFSLLASPIHFGVECDKDVKYESRSSSWFYEMVSFGLYDPGHRRVVKTNCHYEYDPCDFYMENPSVLNDTTQDVVDYDWCREDPQPVPEPSTILLLGAAGAVAIASKRRKTKAGIHISQSQLG